MNNKIYKDPCSLSNPQYFLLKHLEIDWLVNFEKKILEGKCCLHFILNEAYKNTDEETIVFLNKHPFLFNFNL
jgi:hypothetical protein